VRRAWASINERGNWRDEFAGVQPSILALLSAAQVSASRESSTYVRDVLRETDIDRDSRQVVNPAGFVATAGNGLPVADLLPIALTRAEQADSLDAGADWLDLFTQTLIADTARAATSAGMTAHRRVGGYIRMIEPGACSRCAVLAGKKYRWNQGFDRHPACRCEHIPASENILGDPSTDPNAYFESLSAEEQDRIFTKAGAEAIRDGADISQVVNARAGMSTAQINPLTGRSVGRLQTVDVYGRPAYITTTSTTRFGVAYRPKSVRLMPESIYEYATSREDAIRLLRLHGYIR